MSQTPKAGPAITHESDDDEIVLWEEGNPDARIRSQWWIGVEEAR